MGSFSKYNSQSLKSVSDHVAELVARASERPNMVICVETEAQRIADALHGDEWTVERIGRLLVEEALRHGLAVEFDASAAQASHRPELSVHH